MKVGDLVKSKTNSIEAMIGIVLNVEEDFYNRNRAVKYGLGTQHRLTVYWIHGETTTEPDSYVEKLAKDKKNPLTNKKE